MIDTKFFTCLVVFTIVFESVRAQDSPADQCKAKLLDQAAQISSGRLPECLDKDKLNQAKEHTKIIGDVLKDLPPECRKMPKASEVQDCLEKFNGILESKTDQIKTSIVGALHSLFLGSKDCIGIIVNKFKNLDEYVASGCKD